MPARDALRTALRVVLALIGAALAMGLTVALAYLLRTTVDVAADAYRSITYIGVNAPKTLAVTAAALILLVAFPLAIADGVSSARFRRAERELRDARPDASVTPYEGPEGQGLAFDGPDARILLLAPVGGLGGPRTVTLPAQADPALSGTSAPAV